MYEILKDVAAPVVTLIGASTAGIITFVFARTQAGSLQASRLSVSGSLPTWLSAIKFQ
jgi:hypothetical protein